MRDLIEYLILTIKREEEEEYPVVYVKGYEKLRWLRELLGKEI